MKINNNIKEANFRDNKLKLIHFPQNIFKMIKIARKKLIFDIISSTFSKII